MSRGLRSRRIAEGAARFPTREFHSSLPALIAAHVHRESVGYPMLLEAVTKRLGQAPPPRRMLLSALGLLLEVSRAADKPASI